jgi:hypothetical protein
MMMTLLIAYFTIGLFLTIYGFIRFRYQLKPIYHHSAGIPLLCLIFIVASIFWLPILVKEYGGNQQ